MSDRRLATEADLIRHLDGLKRKLMDTQREPERDWMLLPRRTHEGSLLMCDIMNAVEIETGVDADSMRWDRRSPRIVRARFIFCYVARTVSNRSTPNIGKYVKRDHTTVLRAVRQVAAEPQKYEPELSRILAYFGKSKVVEMGENSVCGKPNQAARAM